MPSLLVQRFCTLRLECHVSLVSLIFFLTGLSQSDCLLSVWQSEMDPRMTHSTDHILFTLRFCQKLMRVFYLDLLKLLSRKAWLRMLAVKINK